MARLRPAAPVDLEAVNGVIERAIMTWTLPERVKRLALPGHRYTALDLEHLTLVVLEADAGGIIGVAAWEPADRRAAPAGRPALLLHGIYVDPARQRAGAGSVLLEAAAAAARAQGCDGLLVKAQADAEGFFRARGLAPLAIEHPERDYARRYWLEIGAHDRSAE